MFSQGKTVVLVKNETAGAVSARARIDDDRYRMKNGNKLIVSKIIITSDQLPETILYYELFPMTYFMSHQLSYEQ